MNDHQRDDFQLLTEQCHQNRTEYVLFASQINYERLPLQSKLVVHDFQCIVAILVGWLVEFKLVNNCISFQIPFIMLLAILFLIFLSTETGITVLVKSITILLLGQPNLESFFSHDITNSSVTTNNETIGPSSCDYSIAAGTYNYESASNFDNYLKVQR